MILDYISCWSFILCLLNNQETDFNKGLFDLINNAYILDYLSTTIQVIVHSIQCLQSWQSTDYWYYFITHAILLKA